MDIDVYIVVWILMYVDIDVDVDVWIMDMAYHSISDLIHAVVEIQHIRISTRIDLTRTYITINNNI